MFTRSEREEIIKAVEISLSFANVLRVLGKKGSGTQQRIKKYCIENGIDFSHFTGQGHATKQPKKTFENGSKRVSTSIIKKRLFESGIEKRCNKCGITEWNKLEAPLELHHKDGNRQNNNKSNLEILCSNCHAQTDTYCRRKKYREPPK